MGYQIPYQVALIDLSLPFHDYINRMCRDGYTIHTVVFEGNPATHMRILWELNRPQWF